MALKPIGERCNLEIHGHPWTFSSLDHTSLLPHPKPLPFPQMTQSRPASCGQHILGGSPGAGCVTLQEPPYLPLSGPPLPPTPFRLLFLKHPAWRPDVHSWAAIPTPIAVKQPWGSRTGDFSKPCQESLLALPSGPTGPEFTLEWGKALYDNFPADPPPPSFLPWRANQTLRSSWVSGESGNKGKESHFLSRGRKEIESRPVSQPASQGRL